MTRAADMPPAIAQAWPRLVLVRPQMGENIGAVARAMLNFGLTGLSLVEPRDPWPNPKAYLVSSGADEVLDQAHLAWSMGEALREATMVLATTARPRGLEKPVWGPREAAENLHAAILAGEKPMVLFGAEAHGLTNEEIARADVILTYPVNPGFASLNLANAAAVFCFAYGQARDGPAPPAWFKEPESPPATQAELDGLFDHLEEELVRGRFYHPPEKAALMRINMRSPFMRARLTQQEVQTLRGVIKALTVGRGGRKLPEE
jgi:tRNA/rRNA methyltransferase